MKYFAFAALLALFWVAAHAQQSYPPFGQARAASATTDSSGNWTVTWATATAVAPMISITWENPSGMPVKCELTATPTTTAVQGHCLRETTTALTLSNVTSGLTVSPNSVTAPSGLKVHVIALPPTQ